MYANLADKDLKKRCILRNTSLSLNQKMYLRNTDFAININFDFEARTTGYTDALPLQII